jgi:hypothetical protein
MQKVLSWKGIDNESIERCELHIDEHGLSARSVINGLYLNRNFTVRYQLKTDAGFHTSELELQAEINGRMQELSLQKQNGIWLMNGQVEASFAACIDVDIAVTPLTNTLPIRRLDLHPGAEQKIRLIYIDILEAEVKVLSQRYKRISENVYHYENIPNDFEADITVDDEGLVVDYPGLFNRIDAGR